MEIQVKNYAVRLKTCFNSKSKFDDFKNQLIELVNLSDKLSKQKLQQREKYWQEQLFVLICDLNSSLLW